MDVPAGTVVTITEGTRPGFDAVVWGSITITGDSVDDNGDGSATVTVSDQQDDVNLITVINDATWAPGTFSLTKRIDEILPDHAGVPETVTVIASWTDEEGLQTVEIVVPTNGSATPFPQQLPHGTEVTLSETALEGTSQFNWGSAPLEWRRRDLERRRNRGVTIGAAATANVELVNTAVASLGSFTIVKSLTGAGAIQSSAVAFPSR